MCWLDRWLSQRSFDKLIFKNLGNFYSKFSYLLLFLISVIFLSEIVQMQWTFYKQKCGYWGLGALAPYHQWPQRWVATSCISGCFWVRSIEMVSRIQFWSLLDFSWSVSAGVNALVTILLWVVDILNMHDIYIYIYISKNASYLYYKFWNDFRVFDVWKL